jgi:kynurenine 3-monooxygenase
MSADVEVLVVGAGICGLATALYLARQGLRVRVSEKKTTLDDLATARPSINITLGVRGMDVLRDLGLADAVGKLGVRVNTRHIHHLSGQKVVQPYGGADEAILSLRRVALVSLLLREVTLDERIDLELGERLVRADADGTVAVLRNGLTTEEEIHADFVVGADGLNSGVRKAVCHAAGAGGPDPQRTGMKWIELAVPDSWPDHIVDAVDVWPRDPVMLIAFPNRNGVKTVLLFVPESESFPAHEQLGRMAPELRVTPREYEASLRRQDEVRVVTCPVWHAGRLCVTGDAAHAMTPFLGQGANAALADARELAVLTSGSRDWVEVGRRFDAIRRPEMECLARLASQHFAELSRHMGDWTSSLRRDLRVLLGRYYPGRFQPIYNRVAFSAGSLLTAEREHVAEEFELTTILDTLIDTFGTGKEIGG